MWDKLAKLSNAAAPSGYEGEASALAAEYLKPFVDEVKTDRLGNIFGIKTIDAKAKTLLLDTHLDEVGIMITGRKDGFLRFRTLGSIDPRVLMAREIRLMTGHYGVVACQPPHIQSKEDSDNSVPVDELYLDVGLTDSDCIPIGTVGVFDTAFADLGGCMSGKAMDDRACFMTILRALELVKSHKVNIIVAGTVQEEVGGRGAMVAAYGLSPDYCVAVDVTHAQTPDAPKDRTFKFGGGPCIGVGPSMVRFMSNMLKKLAKENDIPHQIEVSGGNTCTNGWLYQAVREGIPVAELSLPLKYMHSPVEMLNKQDFENTAKLLAAFIEVIE